MPRIHDARKEFINDLYWKHETVALDGQGSLHVHFTESLRKIAEVVGVIKETVNHNVEPKNLTLPFRCHRCQRTWELTKIFSDREIVRELYSYPSECDLCRAADEKQVADSLQCLNDRLREKYGALAVRECPNCRWLTHIAFDPATLEFYEECENRTYSDEFEGRTCFRSPLSAAQRRFYLSKMIALLQAKLALS